jgi:short-subunit dehydrogenase
MKELIVVITGASSGIGKATALEFAKQGAKVVVSARREAPLNELVADIRKLGSDGLAVAADVTDEQAMLNLANAAINTFGCIDIWINNAAVIAFGKFNDIPSHVFKRVIDVNFFGCVNGTRAVLPQFRLQNRGIIINVSSVVGTIGQPYLIPYSASKFAIRGFSEALRGELQGSDIKVCTILPASIDTPLFQHGANYSGKAPKALTPTYDAQAVAKTIIDLAAKPRSEVYVGTIAPLLTNAHKLAPNMTEKTFAAQVRREHFQDKPASRSEGNLFKPMPEHTGISGGWK